MLAHTHDLPLQPNGLTARTSGTAAPGPVTKDDLHPDLRRALFSLWLAVACNLVAIILLSALVLPRLF